MDYHFFEKIGETVLKFSDLSNKIVSKFLDGLEYIVQSETFQALAYLLQNMPDNIAETELYHNALKLKENDIKYQDAEWIIEFFGSSSLNTTVNELCKKIDTNNPLCKYLITIINDMSMNEREKIIILLAHFESYLFYIINHKKQKKEKIKTVVNNFAINDNNGMSLEAMSKIVVAAITYVVFSPTDYYQEEIEKRLPFRNNILHNGIIEYSDENIEAIYFVLVNYFLILTTVKDYLFDTEDED